MEDARSPWPVAVVGAGAAGLLAAIFAARRGARVLLLETRPAPGAKIRVSGGGRSNILPVHVELGDYHTSGSMHALRNILVSWPLADVRAFFEAELSLPLKDEPPAKVFPASDRSRDVVEALLRECRERGISLLAGRRVTGLARVAGEGVAECAAGFALACATGETFLARRVVLATGGLSMPRTGSDGRGLDFARDLGHSVRPTYPALVPLLARDPAWGELAGISLRARLRAMAGGKAIEEREGDFLFTHRGFSGPVALDLSRHVTEPCSAEPRGSGAFPSEAGGSVGTRLLAHWGGSAAPPWEDVLRRAGRRSVAAVVREHLPRRLADRLLALAAVPEGRTTSELRRAERRRLVEALESCPLEVSGNEGYGVAEVTGGGVPLEEIHTRTLQSRIVPGLFFAGEMLDVTGHIGGYNFLWSWVSGRRAGEGAAAETAAES